MVSTKVRIKKCSKCDGNGTIKRFPYFANVMPKKTTMICPMCNGKGEVIIIASGYRTVRESFEKYV